MPAVEKLRIKRDAALIFFYRALQFTDGEIAIGVVKNFLGRCPGTTSPRLSTEKFCFCGL